MAFLLSLLLWLSGSHGRSQTLPNGGKAVYTLIHGSSLTDDCLICDRVTAPVPMWGSFELRLISQGPLFLNYAIENVQFSTPPGGRSYKVTGKGTYRIGGQLAVQQGLALDLMIDNGQTNAPCQFTNVTSMVTGLWPMVQVQAGQSNGTLVQQYTLDIDAAPFREIWFSTRSNFQASIWNAPSNAISGGDLLASSGRVVKRNSQLIGALGIQPLVPDLGLKDIDILADGEIVFSVEQNAFSETLGQLSAEDLLSDRGRIVRHTNPDLIKNFQPTAPLPTVVGLQGVQARDDGQTYFSVQNPFKSGKLGGTVQPGDLLSDQGNIVRSGRDLLAAFSPKDPLTDVGLKAVYVWPSGEIWFSTRDGFADTNGVVFGAGDLLSDRGYVALSNAELLSAFSPSSGTTNDLGLDALFVVSDVTPLIGSASTTTLHTAGLANADVILSRSKGSRVFQLEGASNVLGPFGAIGPITTETLFTDPGATTNQLQRFYRLHQW